MLASIPLGIIRYRLNVETGELGATEGGDEFLILNQALRQLESLNQWKFLEERSSPLTLRSGESYIEPPKNFREIVAIDTTESLLNRMELTSYRHIVELRTSSIQSQSFSYYMAVAHNQGKTRNLLGFTEDFSGASWVNTGVTVSTDLQISPGGEAVGQEQADELRATSTSANILQAVLTPTLENGRDYVWSVYLKVEDATESRILLTQRSDGGGTNSERTPFTQLDIVWNASGEPSVTRTAYPPARTGQNFDDSENQSSADFGVEDMGDGWYRFYVVKTLDLREDQPSEDLSCEIYPDTDLGSGAVFAWGAQLESFEVSTIDLRARPTRYFSNAGAYDPAPGPVVRRFEIWPTPVSDLLRAFTIFYRRRLDIVTQETDEILVPDYAEDLVNELARIYALGYHEEDQAALHDRVASLRQSPYLLSVMDQDNTAQTDYGPLRGLAATQGWFYRDWGSDAVVPSPGSSQS